MTLQLTSNEAVHMLMNDQYSGWSYEGASAMVEFLEACEEQSGEEMNFDVVAIRCEWSEYASVQEAAREYGWVPESGQDGWDAEAMEWLRDRTTVIEFDRKRNAGVIVAGF